MNENTIKIMALGNSITEAENGYNSYRKELWEELTQAGYNVDFVGSDDKNKDGNDFPDTNFDPDHEGHWGWRIDEIINGRGSEGQLSEWLTGYTPDVALIHLGTNDAIQSNSVTSSVEELKQVIDILREDNPNITIFLTKLIPAVNSGINNRIEELNNLIPTIVTDKNQANSPVILVDQNSGFNANTDTYDGIHPNPTGEAKMAQKWFDALKNYFDSVGINPQSNFEAVDDSATTLKDTPVNIEIFANDIAIAEDTILNVPTSTSNGTLAVNNNGTPGDTSDDFVVYTPDLDFTGVDSFTYSIDDGTGVTDTGEVSVTVTEPGDRVNTGLLALYTFDEGSGDTVFDVSGVGTALNLEINNQTGVSWGDGILNIDSPSLIASNQAADKLIDGITATGEITIEAWLTPENRSQSGPARIATLSSNLSNRNFTLGQDRDDYNLRLRTTTTGNNGVGTTVSSQGGLLNTELTHVIYTREQDGDAFLYIDNQLVASETIGGNLSNWNDNYRFGLGNEFNGSRPWLGSLDLLAVYNQAFDATEVEQNFFAGSDGSLSPLPPDAEDDTFLVSENTSNNFLDVLANDSDRNGDTLAISIDTLPTNGTLNINQNNLFYTPNSNFTGVDSFTYQVDDGNGGTDIATVNLTVTEFNNIPVITNDTATTNEDTGVSINVLANDSDTDGDNLTITSVTPGSNGTTAIIDNEIVYTPEPNFNGVDSFIYEISDGNGGTGTATVSVTVEEVNDLPTAENDIATTNQGTQVSINVLENDRDVDGDNLTIASVTPGNNGTTQIVENEIIYTPETNFTGEDSFTYSIDDGNGVTDTAQVSVTIAEPSSRVQSGLLALYTFDEGSGDTVSDVSGVGEALDLEIDNLTGVNWGDGVLNINSSTLIASNQGADKLIDGITATGEITIEAWITPENRSQSGPARIATLSSNVSNRNFTLGQDRDDYNVRLRTTTTGNNGVRTTVSSDGGLLNTELTHVIYTREQDGDAFLYIDGELVSSETISGNLSNWDDSYRFGLGNEFGGDRSWLGSLDLIAVYNQAFDATEVEQNFLAGSDYSI